MTNKYHYNALGQLDHEHRYSTDEWGDYDFVVEKYSYDHHNNLISVESFQASGERKGRIMFDLRYEQDNLVEAHYEEWKWDDRDLRRDPNSPGKRREMKTLTRDQYAEAVQSIFRTTCLAYYQDDLTSLSVPDPC